MSENKRSVETYMEAFGRSDHAAILSCLTDDVEWVIPGMFIRRGKAAFDAEIENEGFVGSPSIRDVFEMQNGKIRRLISYLMETKT